MTIERRIAAIAKDLVRTRVGHKRESDYRALCQSFPMLLRSAGLAQTMAYLRVKKSKAEYGDLYEHLVAQFRNLEFLAENEELSEKAADPTMSQADYRLYSEVAMKVGLWHKRLAQALLGKKGDR